MTRQREDDRELSHRIPEAFSFGSPRLPGLAKIAEEKDEAGVLIGKLMMTGGDSEYWEGRELHPELMEELADLKAAIEVFIELNLTYEGKQVPTDERFRFEQRVQAKKRLFEKWHRSRTELYQRQNETAGK